MQMDPSGDILDSRVADGSVVESAMTSAQGMAAFDQCRRRGLDKTDITRPGFALSGIDTDADLVHVRWLPRRRNIAA